jgi:colanic acid biosynthesis glycosyl transferase WcaI
MRILFFAQCYAPEEVSAAVLITELAVDLAQKEHQVAFVTGAPNYPYGCVYPGYRNRFYQEELLDGVRIIRTWSYISPHKSFWPRILHYGTFSATALLGGLLAGKPDILVSYSPPLPLGLSVGLLSRLWRVPWVLQLEDLYPDAAVAAGMLRNRYAIKFFGWMERFLYRQATHISLISEGFRRNLLGKGVPDEKITLIPVWADPNLVKPMPKENNFRKRHGLVNKFVVMYAGNIGLTSCLEDVLSASAILKEDADIRFVIIGEGVKKTGLQEMAQNKSLDNTLFLPYQPREDFSEMLASADLSLVTLNQNSSLTSLPSKIFNIMASARPILVIAPLESEITHLVKTADCGIAIPPGQAESLARAISDLKQQENRLDAMGWNGRNQLLEKYSRGHCVDMYEHMLLSLCKNVPASIGTEELAKKVEA